MRVRIWTLMVSLGMAVLLWAVTGQVLQGQTPTPPPPPITPTPSWWQLPQEQVPWLLLVGVAAVAAILGGLARPVIGYLGNQLLVWVQSWGKAGRFRHRYLTALVGQCRHLPLLPSNVAANWKYRRRSIELEELYTPLSLGEQRREQDSEWVAFSGSNKRLPRNRWQAFWWRLRPPLQPSAGEIGQILVENKRLVVRGDPGSGKTTLLRYLALSCARSRRNDRKDGDRAQMVRRRFGWRKRPFPIFVSLNLLSDVGQWPEDRRLLDEIIDTLPGELRQTYPKGFFEQQLERGNCLLLLDGFDELGSRSARGKMARLIADLVNMYDHPDNRFVVSTRIVGYEGQLNHFGFNVRTVQDLDHEAVQDLVIRRYRATALGEGVGRSEQEQMDLLQRYETQARRLLAELQRNQGLRSLSVNPLLLSLIVLVHQVQVKLPDQRHLLYRDCVEILTERWQERKRAEAGMEKDTTVGTLSLEQKISILQDLALMMQSQRQVSESQAVITLHEAERLIAVRMPDFIAAYLPQDEAARRQEVERRAKALLDNIREESGILVEKGLDLTGEPVVGFSHLTFQEYLTAATMRERPDALNHLLDNLFNPVWREVLLLYMAMAHAGPVLQACLQTENRPDLIRYLLAGRCLVEQTTTPEGVRRQIMTGLHAYLRPFGAQELTGINELLDRTGGEAKLDWLIDNLADHITEAELHSLAWSVQGQQGSLYTVLQKTLVRLMMEASDRNARYMAGCLLGGMDDPRDLEEMVLVPGGVFLMGSNDDDKGALSSEKPQHQVTVGDFRIGKHLVTNGNYARFVTATGHAAPAHWQNDTPPFWLRNHPVVNVSWHDANAYCAWLSEEWGERVRLPTEAEWEKAARGVDGRIYPWGNEFDLTYTNSSEGRGDWTTTPVGQYPSGASPYGCLDMAGNVWEWTSSKIVSYPYDAKDGREDPDSGASRVLRGGSFNLNRQRVRCAYRSDRGPDFRFYYVGFRVLSPGS